MANVMKSCNYAHFTGNSNYGHSSSPDGATLQPRQSVGNWRPKWRAYSKRRTRRKSFDGAVTELIRQANHFAKLGFYFKGYGKRIVCFQCGLELEVKEGDFDYHTEHSDLAPHCQYIRQLNEDGQSDDSDSGEIDVHHNNDQMTRHTGNILYDTESMIQPQYDGDYTYIYDSEDPWSISSEHNNISHDDDISVSQNQDISTPQKQDKISRDHDSTPQPQYRDTWDDQLTCKVCLSEQVSVTFRPCGHLATCRDCANRLHKCPVCRAFIREKINTFLS